MANQQMNDNRQQPQQQQVGDRQMDQKGKKTPNRADPKQNSGNQQRRDGKH